MRLKTSAAPSLAAFSPLRRGCPAALGLGRSPAAEQIYQRLQRRSFPWNQTDCGPGGAACAHSTCSHVHSACAVHPHLLLCSVASLVFFSPHLFVLWASCSMLYVPVVISEQTANRAHGTRAPGHLAAPEASGQIYNSTARSLLARSYIIHNAYSY
jgi:hypothetical protein